MTPANRAVALVFLLAACSPARADWIPWTYSWSNNPDTILADNPAGGGKISLSDETSNAAVGNTDIVATNIHTFSTAPQTAPDTFTNKAYTLTLHLTDTTSGQSGTAVFSGEFNGTLTATSSNITNAFTGATTAVLDLGANQYTVKLTAYTPPGPSGSVNAGAISAHASVVVEPITIVAQSPEPPALLLAVCGVPLAVPYLRRVRRR
jgi:hypothetical protein